MANIFAPQALPSSPTSQQTTTGGLNAWAQPYVTDLLKQAQGLSADPTALQQQSYQNVSNLGVAPQIGQATGMASGAAQGAMGTAGTALDYGQQGAGYGAQGLGYGQQGVGLGVAGGAQYGQQGAGYGQQATGAGQQYANMATDPSQMAAYMNPYVQQSLAPQLDLLNQQQALQGQQIQGQATSQGAFGGNRATLAQGLNAQNYDLARQQAIAQGYNTAFTNAQQAQQFGANLGLQGLQTGIQGAQAGLQGVGTQLAGTAQGMQGAGLGIQGAQAGLQGVQGAQNAYGLGLQGANTLGQLGQNQFNQQATAAQLQNQLGTQQYLMPQQLLQTKQNMLQGLPVGSSMTQGWQSGPNSLSQGIGAVGAIGTLFGGGANSAFNTIKGMFPGSTTPTPYYPTNPDPSNPNNITTIQTPIDTTVPDYYNQGPGDPVMPDVPSAKGGVIKGYAQGGAVQSYASGGISSINNAVRNDPTAYSEQTVNGGVQHGILDDITKLIALSNITKERSAMQNQQAMQSPPPPGSVAQQLAAQLQQQRQQMPQQMAQMVPPQQPQGIDSAQSNLPQQYAGGGIIAFNGEDGSKVPAPYDPSKDAPTYISELPAYLKEKLSPFLRGLREQINTGKAAPGATWDPTVQAGPETVVAPTPVPVAPVAAKPSNDIIIHPNAPRVAAAGPSTPTAADAASQLGIPQTDTSGITDLLKGYADKITGSEDFGQSRQDANISALRKFFLGMAAGKSPYFFTNATESGLAAQEGLDKTLEGIQARKDKQITQLMGLGLKGEELKNAAKKLGIDETELKAKIPLYGSEVKKNEALAYKAMHPTTSSGGITAGIITPKDLAALDEKYDALAVNPKADPAFYASLGKRVQDLLSAKPGTKSYNEGMNEVKLITEARKNEFIKRAQILGARKVPISTSED